MLTSPKICVSTTLENMKWQIYWAVNGVMYILMNHWIATHMTSSCLKIVKRVISHIIFTLYDRNVHRVPRCRLSTNWNHASRTTGQIWITLFIECAVGDVAPASTRLRSRWRQTFRSCDVNIMWLTTRLTIFETITTSRVCRYAVIHSNVHVSTALTAQSVTSNFAR